jgi:leukotriene A-4 hydrolase/aminopeptidase
MARIDPHSYFDDAQPLTRHWQLRWFVDFPARVLRGEATLTLAAPGSGPLDLDTKSLTIKRVTLAGTSSEIPFELGREEPILGRRLRLSLPPQTSRVTIAYKTSPEAIGLQWLAPEQTAGGQQPFLFSQCQAIHARTLTPCQDCAAARVSYEAEVDVPEGLTAVMSAGPGTDAACLGRHIWRFNMPQPIPSYLLALAVGQLESRELSSRARVWAEPATVESAAWEFAETEAYIRSAESLFGPYEWERFDMLVLPPSFPYGGMENPRMTFLTPTLLAGDRSLVDVVAHELAHSWTGNLVTNATAEHFWLNEGFTVWAERKLLKALRGEEAEALAWAVGRKDLDDALQRFQDQPELTVLRPKLAGVDPDDAYSSVPYEKGALLVAALERAAGQERFQGFVREYIARFRFQSITTEAFCDFCEEKLPGLLGRIGAQAWLHEPGLPEGAPRFASSRLEALERLAGQWRQGRRPSQAEAAAWRPVESVLYLSMLPRDLSVSECAGLEAHLGLGATKNCEILVEWLRLALVCGYEPAFARAREMLLRVGRMKYVRPLYQALGKTPKGRSLARETFAKASPLYHALTRRAAQDVMAGYND